MLLQGLFVEELDAAEGDGGRGPGYLLFISQIEKVLAQLFLAQLIRAAAVMLGQLPDGPCVSLLGSCRQSPQLHILKHPLL